MLYMATGKPAHLGCKFLLDVSVINSPIVVEHRVLVGKSEGKRPLGRTRHRWEDNIKMDLQEVGGGRGDWMELAHIGTGGGHLCVR